jgi:ribosomal protein L31
MSINLEKYLEKTHPKIVHASKCICKSILSEVNVGKQSTKNGSRSIEVEACFGSLVIQKGKKNIFTNAMRIDKLLEKFESFSGWDCKSDDWYSVYDYYLYNEHQQRVRVIFRNGERSTEHISKISLASKDFIQNGSKYVTRINIKRETQIVSEDTLDIMRFRSMKISFRKSMQIRSASIKGVSFRYEFICYWTGNTYKAAEKKMKTSPPISSVEIEIVFDDNEYNNEPSWRALSADEVLMLSADLIIKCKDLFKNESEFKSVQ